MKTSIKIKQMKKKILLGSIASLFAVATVFNMGLLSFNKQSDATLEAISIMIKANGENNSGRMTNDEYFEATGCDSTTDDVSCTGKDGKTYAFSVSRD